MEEYMHGHGDMRPEEGGVTTEEDTRKWRMLQALQVWARAGLAQHA